MAIRALIGAWLLLAVQALAAATGQIQGKVMGDSSGTPLSEATVTAYRISPAPTVSNQTTSAKDGTFTVGNLVTGKYGICVTDISGTLLNPCEWRDTETTVDVTDGKTTAAVTVKVKTASTMQLKINDTGNALAMKPDDVNPPHVLVGVWDLKGIFHPALETKTDGGRTFKLRIPFDSPLRLHVLSKLVALESEDHTPVPPGGHIEVFAHDSGKNSDQQKSFALNATGRKP